jgi:hypothetical protein
MKSVENKLACGTFFMAYLDCLLIWQLITGFEIIKYSNIFFILLGLPLIFFLGNRCSKNYDEDNNNNKLFYIIIIILIGICLFLGYRIATLGNA